MLAASDEFVCDVFARTESGVLIQYTDALGKRRNHHIDRYVAFGMGGSVLATIEKNGTVNASGAFDVCRIFR